MHGVRKRISLQAPLNGPPASRSQKTALSFLSPCPPAPLYTTLARPASGLFHNRWNFRAWPVCTSCLQHPQPLLNHYWGPGQVARQGYKRSEPPKNELLRRGLSESERAKTYYYRELPLCPSPIFHSFPLPLFLLAHAQQMWPLVLGSNR